MWIQGHESRRCKPNHHWSMLLILKVLLNFLWFTAPYLWSCLTGLPSAVLHYHVLANAADACLVASKRSADRSSKWISTPSTHRSLTKNLREKCFFQIRQLAIEKNACACMCVRNFIVSLSTKGHFLVRTTGLFFTTLKSMSSSAWGTSQDENWEARLQAFQKRAELNAFHRRKPAENFSDFFSFPAAEATTKRAPPWLCRAPTCRSFEHWKSSTRILRQANMFDSLLQTPLCMSGYDKGDVLLLLLQILEASLNYLKFNQITYAAPKSLHVLYETTMDNDRWNHLSSHRENFMIWRILCLFTRCRKCHQRYLDAV